MCGSTKPLHTGKHGERLVQRKLEDLGYVVHNANIIFRQNCPNIDLVVYSVSGATYIQVKSSANPAGKGSIIIDGSTWNRQQLDGTEPIYNKKVGLRASFIVLVDLEDDAAPQFYVVPPEKLTELVRPRALEFSERPKRDGSRRSLGFRKELPKELLSAYINRWQYFGEPAPASE
jgi:Nuclease-related domain